MEASARTEPGEAIRYRNRETGAIEREEVFGENALRWLYESAPGRALTDAVLSRRLPNRIYGLLQRRPDRGAERVRAFVDKLGIDASEAEKPLSHYRSLDDFFTRRLKRSVRPIDPDPSHLVAPADSRVLVIPELRHSALRIKNSEVSLEELLGDPASARQYEGGAAVVCRLAPADYHRFHFPDSGVAARAHRTRGRLHSVHPIALSARAPSFRNKRTVTRLLSQSFGDMTLVEVGALLVGTIVQSYTPGRIARGQEKGYFRFGGSTVILLTEPGRLVIDEDLVRDSAASLEVLVKMGTRIGVRAP